MFYTHLLAVGRDDAPRPADEKVIVKPNLTVRIRFSSYQTVLIILTQNVPDCA